MHGFSLLGMIRDMGWPARAVGLLLVAMAIYYVAVAAERLSALSTARNLSMRFVLQLREKLRAGDLKAALALASAPPGSPLARLAAAALSEHEEALAARAKNPSFDVVDAVDRAVERARERELADLRRGLSGLATVATAAPFVGLFGTVMGIMNAFSSMASQGGGLQAVSGGISEALITTAAGLAVAIASVMTFNHFTTRVEELLVDMNEVGGELVAFVLKREPGAIAK
jgi:biopolymer transport protein ExbB/TolQ